MRLPSEQAPVLGLRFKYHCTLAALPLCYRPIFEVNVSLHKEVTELYAFCERAQNT